MPQDKPANQQQVASAHEQRPAQLGYAPLTPTTQVGLSHTSLSHAGLSHTAVQRGLANPRALAPADILQLQRTAGNQAVQRMLQPERAPASIQRKYKKKGKQQIPNADQQQVNFNGQSRVIESDQENPFAFQKAIGEMAVSGVKPVAAGQQPKAVMLMGAVGAGKSLLIPELVPDRSNFVHADADIVKEAIPEYKVGIAQGDKEIATKVHSKSKAAARGIGDTAIRGRYNLLFDGSGGDLGEYKALMSSMRRAGYHITLAMTHISVDEGLKRVAARAQATGRDIPKDKVIDMYKWAPINFPQLVPLVDQAYLFDNMVPQGETPHLIWESKDGRKIDQSAIDRLTQLLASISQKSQDDIQSGKVDNSTGHSPLRPVGNPRYLERDGWAAWIDENHSDKFGLTTSRREIRGIDKNLKKYDRYKAKNRGNAKEQAQLLLHMQSESKNSRYQSGLNKNTKTFNRRQSATLRLLHEIDGELKSNPLRLAKVSEAEQIKELVTVGFSPKFLSGILKLDLRLLYQAHAALAHHQTTLAQRLFDRLNPVQRDKNKKLDYNGDYIKRSRSEMFLPQQMIMAHHHQVIGGAYASAFSGTPMDAAQLQKVTNKYVRNKDFIDQNTLDAVKNKGVGAKSLDDLIADNTGLLPQELEAIRMYSGSIYRPMNATQQDARLDDPKAQKKAKGYNALNQLAMSGLSKLPSYAGTEVWRGDREFTGMRATLRTGTVYQTPSFLSTTKKTTFGTTGANIGWIIKVAPNSRGKDIEHLSTAEVEKEVLFPPGTKLRITYVLNRQFHPLDPNITAEQEQRDDESLDDYIARQWQAEDQKKIPYDKLITASRSGVNVIIYADEV